MIKKFKQYFVPKVESEIQDVIDRKALINICYIFFAMFIFESIALLIFVFTRPEFDQAAQASIKSVSFCIASCLVGAVVADRLRKKEKLQHIPVVVFKVLCYLVLSVWSIDVAMRDYDRGHQMLTFFAVQLLMVCFVPVKPIVAIILPSLVYALLYYSLYVVDGALGVNIFNYVLVHIITITGLIGRYYSELTSARKSVELEHSNDQLFYTNRHDGLTGLRNRKALEEDSEKIINTQVTAYMIDINYFKEINDNYGHAVGDDVLRETAKWLKSVFKADRCYRYGGDEFLILGSEEDSYEDDTCTLTIAEMHGKKILLSIGRADGEPKDHDELFRLIAKADESLYKVKKRTHSPEYGGHGERKKGLI